MINEKGVSHGVNTNLEEISDWLTKILVGAGLVQLASLGKALETVGAKFQGNLGNSELVVLAIVVNFSVWGFFSGYLLTRLFLAGAFQAAASDILPYLRGKEIKGKELESAGEYEKARTQFEQALRKVDATTPKDIKRRLYEGIIFNSLYEEPPRGFDEAIKYAQQFLTDEPQIPAPLLWVYLSFAYGQQYRYMRDNTAKLGATEDDLKAVRTRALEALKRALTLEPSLKSLARMVWDPNDPSKSPGSEDNDLEPFKDDPDFVTLLHS
jgi:tetratricopeptide (TPR) repeat protein